MERLEVEVEGTDREMCHQMAKEAAEKYFGSGHCRVIPPVIVEPGEWLGVASERRVVSFRARFTFQSTAE